MRYDIPAGPIGKAMKIASRLGGGLDAMQDAAIHAFLGAKPSIAGMRGARPGRVNDLPIEHPERLRSGNLSDFERVEERLDLERALRGLRPDELDRLADYLLSDGTAKSQALRRVLGVLRRRMER